MIHFTQRWDGAPRESTARFVRSSRSTLRIQLPSSFIFHLQWHNMSLKQPFGRRVYQRGSPFTQSPLLNYFHPLGGIPWLKLFIFINIMFIFLRFFYNKYYLWIKKNIFNNFIFSLLWIWPTTNYLIILLVNFWVVDRSPAPIVQQIVLSNSSI